jgi:hypothetical protein
MKRVSIIAFTFSWITVASLFSQTKQTIGDLDASKRVWSKGSILMNDQTEYLGEIQYNEIIGVLTFRRNELSESFSARSVLMFKFEDSISHQQRTFLSLPLGADLGDKKPKQPFFDVDNPFNSKTDYSNDNERGNSVLTFFEVLRQCESFVLLSHKNQARIDLKDPDKLFDPQFKTVNKQNETIFFMDADGILYPYIEFLILDKSYEIVEIQRSKTKKDYADRDVLKKFLTPHYEEVMYFAESNKLKEYRKNDLLQIIDYYINLSSN